MQKLFPNMAAFVLALAAVSTGHTQSAVDGAIGGTIRDNSGAVVPKAVVTVRNNGTNATQTITADDSGFFRALQLQSGEYTVSVQAAGFAAYEAPKVVVSVG